MFKGNETEENDVNLIRNGLPVMIWFHGGSFSSGSSLNHGPINDDWIPDPRELASNGEVITTIDISKYALCSGVFKNLLFFLDYCSNCAIQAW